MNVYIVSLYVLIVILFIVLLIISFSLLEHLHHSLINDPDSNLDPADTKARDKKEAKFTEWMDKTLSTRRAKLNRSKKKAASKLKGFVVDDDDVDYEDEGEESSELDDLD
jgi:hypothetical protein